MFGALKKILVVTALIAALTAISAPAALASYDFVPFSNSSPSASAASGFAWGDAALGASAALAVMALGAAVVVLARRDREVPTSTPAR
jgi:hypothetical protein